MINQIKKRDGRLAEFNIEKITDAIFKAAQALGGSNREMAQQLALEAERYLEERLDGGVPEVEQIQDAVERTLVKNGHSRTAKEFILYRAERTRARDMNT